MRGFLALVIALVAAVALPASAQRIWPADGGVVPPAGSDLPVGRELHSIAPGSVEAMPGSGGVIFAGLPETEVPSQPVNRPVSSVVPAPDATAPANVYVPDAGESASAPEEVEVPQVEKKAAVPKRQISSPDMKRAWLSTQLPKEVPRQDYSGWANITVDDQGQVSEARITTSCGDLKVDKATLARLAREPLEPAVETLADGTRVPIAYEGQWFFRWILLRSE